MLRIPTIDTPDYIDFLINKKFPMAHILKQPATNSSIGFGAATFQTQGVEALRQKVQAYKAELTAKTANEIKSLYSQEVAKQRKEQEKSHFFNQPETAADFEYWAKMSHWTLDEAIALIHGKNPKIVFWEALNKWQYLDSTFVLEYSRIRELASRAKDWQKLYDPILPQLFINWAKKNDIPVPDELSEKVASRHNNLIDWKKMYDDLLEKNNSNVETANRIIAEKNQKIQKLENADLEVKPLHTKEKETLLKLVIGMAVSGYRYDPKANRNDAVPEIVHDLESLGIPLDAGTIRKWLKEAIKILP
jgi:hypothetical protein